MNEKHILVVEDDPALLEALQIILEEEGYTVWTATNGVKALQVLKDVRADLIVADIKMPRMDGYAFCEAVRSQPRLTRVPFIFLTAKAARDDILAGKALGAVDYITKPFDPHELLVVVRARLGCA
jgi:DNA-binding response OmpR family regulator